MRLQPAAVARVATELSGFGATILPFEPGRPVSPARAAHWRKCLAHLRHAVLDHTELMASPLTRATVFRTLAATLVETSPNPLLETLGAVRTPDQPATPRTLRRAIQYVDDHAGDDIGLADIAAAAGTGVRTLQLAFRWHLDTTPLEYSALGCDSNALQQRPASSISFVVLGRVRSTVQEGWRTSDGAASGSCPARPVTKRQLNCCEHRFRGTAGCSSAPRWMSGRASATSRWTHWVDRSGCRSGCATGSWPSLGS